MRRIVPLLACLACAASATPAAARSVASAGLRECHTSADATARYAIFRSEMRAVGATSRMAVRFDLLSHADDSDVFATVAGPGLGKWISSAPGVDIFRFNKQVANLMAPAAYRAKVHFRWYGADGRVIRRESHRTAVCAQPDPRADLAIDGVRAERVAQPGLARYLVALRNTGQATAPPFDVALVVDGVAQAPLTVKEVDAGDGQTVSFVARRCRPGGSLKVSVDPDDRVTESDEADNERLFTCPTMDS